MGSLKRLLNVEVGTKPKCRRYSKDSESSMPRMDSLMLDEQRLRSSTMSSDVDPISRASTGIQTVYSRTTLERNSKSTTPSVMDLFGPGWDSPRSVESEKPTAKPRSNVSSLDSKDISNILTTMKVTPPSKGKSAVSELRVDRD